MRSSFLSDERVKDDKSGILSYVDGKIKHKWESIPKLVTQYHTTQGIFKDNKRCNDNFLEAEYIVLDFDEGILSPETILDTIKQEGISCHLMGSKNHMVDKGDGKGIIPRCHLYMPIDVPITTVGDYRLLVDAVLAELGWDKAVDIASKRAVQYWFKKKHHLGTLVADPLPSKFLIDRQKKRQEFYNSLAEEKAKKIRKELAKKGITDPLVAIQQTNKWKEQSLLIRQQGSKHNAGVSLAGTCKAFGIGEFDAVNLILSVAMSQDHEHHRKTIHSIYKK
jgi:hypothetical protein